MGDVQAEVSLVGELTQDVPDDVLVVNDDCDYVQACKELSVKVSAPKLVRIWVKSRVHFVWLQGFTTQIDCPSEFHEKTPRTVLAEKWNVSLPDWLDDKDIVEQGLLEIPVESAHFDTFETRLLTHFLGVVFRDDTIDAENLTKVVVALTDDSTESEMERYSILERCLEAKVNKWRQDGREAWLDGICDELLKSPTNVWKWLSLWALLYRYPEKLWEYVLTPKQILLIKGIPGAALNELPIESVAREQAEEQIRLFFEDIGGQISSGDEFIALIERTSGRLSIEYKYLSGILAEQRFDVAEREIRAMREQFKACPGISPGMLAELGLYIKPSRPRAVILNDELSAQVWIDWITEEYLPYRNWQVFNNFNDNEIEDSVTTFSDWYIQQYTNIHQDIRLSLIHILSDSEFLPDDDEFVLVIIADCVPVVFMGLLDECLRNVGMNRHAVEYRFAPLPTSTEYSKPLLMSGQFTDYAKDYAKILALRSNSSWNNTPTLYFSNLKALADMEPQAEPAIAFLNFMEFDELLHSDVVEKNSTYEAEFHRIAARLSETLRSIADAQASLMKGLRVHVVTDHGACRILEEEKKAFDAAIVSSLFADEKHRYARVSENDADSVPDGLWSIGYRFKRPFITEDVVFFLPRGHSTVKNPKKGSYYMHGGVTPEEVLVPAAVYKTVKAEWKKPLMRFLDLAINTETGLAQFFVQRRIPLELEIQNPNDVPLRIERCAVLSPETDLKEFDTPEIDAGKAAVVHLDCYFQKSALDDNSLEIEVSYEISGETRTVIEQIDAEFKSAIRTGISLKDL